MFSDSADRPDGTSVDDGTIAAALVHAVGDVLSVLSTNGVFAYASSAARPALGWAPEALIGRSAYELVHPADREALAEVHGRALQAAEPEVVTYRMLRGDGAYAWVETSVCAGADPIAGEIAALHCATRDISGRLSREQELSDRSTAVESAVEGLGILADDGRYLSLNPAHAALLGVEVAAALLEPWTATLDPGSHEPFAAGLAQAAGGERAVVDVLAGDGTGRELRVTLVRRAPDGFFVSSQDVTAGRRMERALQASEQRWRAVARNLPDIAVLVVDPGLRYVAADGQALERAGWEPGELIGQVVGEERSDGTDPERGARLRELYGAALAGATREEEHRSADGRWYTTRYVPLAADDGTVMAAMAVSTDVTHHRALEERLRHLAEHDPLTGLANRRSFERALADHVARSARYGREGAVVLIDLDHFKQVNDQHGHAAGDRLLVAVAAAFTKRLRSTDLTARLGGDEFVLLLPKADDREVEIVAADLARIVREVGADFALADGIVSASIGAAVLAAGPDRDGAALIAAADAAMYRAKAGGRDGVAFA